MLITVLLLTIYLPEVMMTSSEVTDAFLSITHGEDRNVKLVPKCLSRQDGSNDMPHDLLDLDRDLDLRSNFKLTF